MKQKTTQRIQLKIRNLEPWKYRILFKQPKETKMNYKAVRKQHWNQKVKAKQQKGKNTT